jgi:hypothetical protein
MLQLLPLDLLEVHQDLLALQVLLLFHLVPWVLCLHSSHTSRHNLPNCQVSHMFRITFVVYLPTGKFFLQFL